ncbi:RsiV family protein [Aquimarina gracilis]|uniref:RsiV family protein n=1 Tax=Aquimarina gracilis TaxID=874422 RepID=A0ABU5ZZV6_9FLAO|nr:RsiV family protein [Aquimarina gracilis]MEB3347406.1 RsiV family protein [Aquimarina gracilis]
MKNILVFLFLLAFISCKNEKIINDYNSPGQIKKIEHPKSADNKKSTQVLKSERLLSEKDDKLNLEHLITTKTFFKKQDNYVLNYKYPYLNEDIKSSYKVFNQYIQNNYLKTETAVSEVLKNNSLSCDSSVIDVHRYKRIIDYKIYGKENQLISILLYKANHYTDENHSSYMFKCLNFDLDVAAFLDFNTLFKKNAETEMLSKINQKLINKISKENHYNSCWELTRDHFEANKDSFVITNTSIKFYFNDCIICPSYTGRYAVEIPIEEMAYLLNKDAIKLIL